MLLHDYKQKFKQGALCLLAMAMPVIGFAQETAAAVPATPAIGKYQMMRYLLTGMALLLLCIIIVMANAVAGAGKIYWDHERKKKSKPILPLLILALAGSITAHAQQPDPVVAVATGSGIPKDIYLFFVIVALEFIIVMVLSAMLIQFLRPKTETVAAAVQKAPYFKDFFKKVNQTVAIEEEASIDLHHDYDGIRELDNKVPKWWQYAFAASVLFGIVYLYRMFVAGSLPDQIQELGQANEIAAIQQAAYNKNAANNVDENNVAMLDASGIADGAMLFAKNCVACHGDQGQGTVGPNLTDSYWLHDGDLKSIFQSIKYGWPEKGMKSWKDDFSPAQIAQLASYIKSLSGTNPPGGKEPQGTAYTETTTAMAADSTKTKR